MTDNNLKNVTHKLAFGCLNVCGLKSRLNFPEFIETLACHDVLCVTETKLDDTDVISIPGYNFMSQHRKQKYLRKSGGIGIIYKSTLENKIKIIDTESDYILWVKLDKTLFNTDGEFILGVLYIPPAQSRFLNDDEYNNLEMEITSVCSQTSYICLTGDMNAKTSRLCDFITADETIADVMNFDQETLSFYNQSELLEKMNINKYRNSCDNKTNNNGYRLIDICINNNLFILNGRFGKDSSIGKCTFRDQSLIDYTICSINTFKLLLDFEVIETDFLLSDGHALLSWSVSTCFHEERQITDKIYVSYKKWDQQHMSDFITSIPIEVIDDLCSKLNPSKDAINEIANKVAYVYH